MNKKVCLITGVGPGTGKALAARFSEGGYEVAMIARDSERLASLQEEIPNTHGFSFDCSDEHAINEMVAKVTKDVGAPHVVFHNAVRGTFGSFLEINPEDLLTNFQINTMAMLYLARAVAPTMIERGNGVIMASGNTAALRGKPNFAGFAPSKAAQRILCESLARTLGPQGIHVAYLIIDAVIDLKWTREMLPDEDDDYFIKPSAIAETAFHVAHQDKSGWSFNVEVRPFGEVW